MVDVVVVDAHPIIQSGIELLVSQNNSLRFAGGVNSLHEAMPLIQAAPTGVVILNLPLPISSGFVQLSQLRKAFPTLGIVVLSALDESVYAESCFQAGGNAFVSKRAALKDILAAIESASRHEMYCSEELKDQLVKRAAAGFSSFGTDPTGRLSNAESQVFEMIGEGMTTQQIAKALKISSKTVETYRTRMKQKLGFRGGTQLSHFAMMQTVGQKLAKFLPRGNQDVGFNPAQEK